MARRRLLRLAVLAPLAAAALLVPPGARPATSTGRSAPGYRHSKLKITLPRTARAGSILTVTFSGSNRRFTQGAPITYSLAAFVQKRSTLPKCPRSYDEEFN